MTLTRNFVLPLAALFFGLLLIPQAAQAGVADCPTEPAQNVPIAPGDVFAGTNCTLNTTGDVDSFMFSANSGDIYQFEAGINTGSENLCLTIYSPSASQIFSACNNGADGVTYVTTVQMLPSTGTYTIAITEATSNGALNYGTSLERIYPTPPGAKAVTLGTAVTGDFTPVTDVPAYTFSGYTTGTYEVAASDASGVYEGQCASVYSPTGALVTPASGYSNPACTNTADGVYTLETVFTPTQDGTYLVLLSDLPLTGSYGYNFEVSCLVGNCGTTKTPPCTLKDSLSYDTTTSTLTMKFTVENTAVTSWNAWPTDQNTMTALFSASQPITNPAQTITKTTTLSPEGTVGVLTTLTTATKGIACSSYTQINTGTPTPTKR